jgi:methionyl-tRNA formyltransferase
MTKLLNWDHPRTVGVVVDNDSWIIPFAHNLVQKACAAGDDCYFVRRYDDVRPGSVAFFLGCLRITPPEILARNSCNLVVHASDLPNGRGFSPLTWQILEGCNDIPVCLIEAVGEVDAGPVIYRDRIIFDGHELLSELQNAVGEKTVELCLRYLAEEKPRVGEPQGGTPTIYRRRGPNDSRLDLEKSLSAQFNLLRVVSNEKYPAWFEYRGHRYKLIIQKCD